MGKADISVNNWLESKTLEHLTVEEYLSRFRKFHSDLQIIFHMLKCRENNIEKIPGEDLSQKGESMNMCKAIQEMYDDGRKDGYESGSEEKLIELVMKKMKKNKSVEEIADALEEKNEVIQAIYDTVNTCGIDSTAQDIRLKMME